MRRLVGDVVAVSTVLVLLGIPARTAGEVGSCAERPAKASAAQAKQARGSDQQRQAREARRRTVKPTSRRPFAAKAGERRSASAAKALPETSVERRRATAPAGLGALPASCPPDVFEDDDIPVNAGPVAAGECQARNHCEDASDWLALLAVAGQTFGVDTCNFGFESDTLVRVFDPGLILVASDDDGGACDPRASSVTFTAAQTGTYLIEVTQSDGLFGSDREYDLCLCTADPFEPDDSAAATPLPLGTCQGGHNHCDDESDWVRFDVTAGMDYTIHTCTLGPSSDTVIQLYDSTLSPVAFDDDGGPCEFLTSGIFFTATETATWYAEVGQYFDRFGPGRDYSVCLFAGCVLGDPFEDDDVAAQATTIALEECQNHNHVCDDTQDWLSFDAVAGAWYLAKTCNNGSASDTFATAYDPALGPLAADDNGGDCDPLSSSVLFQAGASGTHFVSVTQADGQGGAERDYLVCLFGGCSTPDIFEEDDDPASATPIDFGQCQDHDHCEDSRDWMSFPVTAGETYTVKLCALGASGFTSFIVHDSTLTPFTSGFASDFCPIFSGASFVATETGTWTLEVNQDFGRIGPETAYRACVDQGCTIGDFNEDDDTPAAAVEIFDFGCQFHDHCDDPSDWLFFDAVAGQPYTLDTCNIGTSSDTLMRLYDSGLTLIDQGDDFAPCDPLASFIELIPALSGRYYVEITQADGTAGADREYLVCLATCVGPDPFEDDDGSPTANPIAVEECQVKDHCDDGVDWASFPVTAGERYTVETCTFAFFSDTVVYVLDSTLNQVAFDDDSGACSDLSSSASFTADETATWFARVESVRGPGAAREYELCLRSGSVAPLLRNGDITCLDPLTPPRDQVLPLDPFRDFYLSPFTSGDLDPEPTVDPCPLPCQAGCRPLIFYGIDRAAVIWLVKAGSNVRVEF